MEYAQEMNRWEWLQNVAVTYLFEGNEEDFHRALRMWFQVRGTQFDGTRQYRWSPIYYRAPLYKKWLYYEIGPEVVWRVEKDWDPETSLRVGIHTLFWGTPYRWRASFRSDFMWATGSLRSRVSLAMTTLELWVNVIASPEGEAIQNCSEKVSRYP